LESQMHQVKCLSKKDLGVQTVILKINQIQDSVKDVVIKFSKIKQDLSYHI